MVFNDQRNLDEVFNTSALRFHHGDQIVKRVSELGFEIIGTIIRDPALVCDVDNLRLWRDNRRLRITELSGIP